MMQSVYSRLCKMSRPELRKIVKTAEAFTTTNCGWLSYRSRHLVIELAKDRLEVTKPKKKIKKGK